MLITDDEDNDSDGDGDSNHVKSIPSFAGAPGGSYSGLSCEFLQEKPLHLYKKGDRQGKGRERERERVEKGIFVLECRW